MSGGVRPSDVRVLGLPTTPDAVPAARQLLRDVLVGQAAGAAARRR
jgi:hypothetical protein